MATKINDYTKTKLSIGIAITLLLAMSGTYYLSQDDDAYYCQSRDIVMICEKLSSGVGSRCYFEDTYKSCSEGWVKMELAQELTPELNYPQAGTKWSCSVDGCILLE